MILRAFLLGFRCSLLNFPYYCPDGSAVLTDFFIFLLVVYINRFGFFSVRLEWA